MLKSKNFSHCLSQTNKMPSGPPQSTVLHLGLDSFFCGPFYRLAIYEAQEKPIQESTGSVKKKQDVVLFLQKEKTVSWLGSQT